MLRNFFATTANTWWNLYTSGAAPEKELSALAERDIRGSTVLMRILLQDDSEVVSRQILQIMEQYLAYGVPAEKIFQLLDQRNVIGENVFHSLAHRHDDMQIMRWQGLLRTILERYSPDQKKSLTSIYKILNNKAAYYSNVAHLDKFIDRIHFSTPYVFEAHALLVLEMAQAGLSREQADTLLTRENDTLHVYLFNYLDENLPGVIVDLFQRGFFREDEYSRFVELKECLLNYILGMPNAEEQRVALKQVIDPAYPLGQLFRLKSSSEYLPLNLNRGLLQKAVRALNAQTFLAVTVATLAKMSVIQSLAPTAPITTPELSSPVSMRLE